MKILIIITLAYLLAMGCAFIYIKTRYPSGSSLKPDVNGVIHHPKYGDYPAEIKYSQGMTLMPGQSTEIHAVAILSNDSAPTQTQSEPEQDRP